MHPPRTIASAIVECIGEGRSPSTDELEGVARHIWSDVRGSASAFAWGDLTDDSSERQLIMRVANTALSGSSSR